MTITSIDNDSEFLSYTRLSLLIRSQVISQYRSWLSTSAALAGIIIFISLFANSDSVLFYNTSFGYLIILGGLLFSSKAFQELHDKTRNEAFLLLPASMAEKTLARLLVSTIGFVAYALIFMLLTSLLAELVKSLFFGNRLPIFNPLAERAWQLVWAYLFIQSFYFLGASWFKKNHAVKTTLSLLCIFVGLSIFALLIASLFFGSFSPGSFDLNISIHDFFYRAKGPGGFILRVFVFLLPLVLWMTAWLRVKESQVSDAI
ncbi:MAG: hypothetical protein KTR16_17285 [Acidiferrobacterales bacterium]|nr:hypothetical protein [Acidiferrobacterales bacterium]